MGVTTTAQQTPAGIADVRRRRFRRVVPSALVALVGAANIVIGLFPAPGVHVLDLAGPWVDRALVQTGRLASVELGFVLVLIARKLSQGSQSTWRLAVALTALGPLVTAAQGHLSLTSLASGVACLALLATGSSYRLRRPGRRYSTWWVVAGVAGGLLLFATVRFAQIDAALEEATLVQRVSMLTRTTLFLPGGLDQESPTYEALAAALRVGLVVVLIGTFSSLRPRRAPGGADRDATAQFAFDHGTSPTAPLIALPDNLLLPLCSGRALAAVGVHSGTAVCLGGPVAERGYAAEALGEFTAYCEQAGWVPALLGSDTTQRDVAADAGYASLKIGVEAVLDIANFSTAGKRRSNVRHSVSRAAREGVTVLPYADGARTPSRTEQLGQVSAEWLADKGGPELGFTLGRFDPERLDDQEVYVAVLHEGTAAEQVVGFVTWLPYDHGDAAVLDLMRRSQECPPGVMEMLIVESLADFARAGRKRASLGGVPLAQAADVAQGPRGVAQNVLAWTYTNGGSLYDARGLFRFKDKFDPRWEPMWLSYPKAGDLPRIAVAAARAFLPPHAVRDLMLTKQGRAGLAISARGTAGSVAQRFAELDRAERSPADAPFVRVPWAAMVVTGALLVAAVQTWESLELLPQFDEAYAWSAQSVLDGQWWRLITATVLTEHLAAWIALAGVTAALLAVLERMIGSVRAFLICAAGAVWGYLGTTLFLLAGSSLGWDLATNTLETTDYGPSSGTAAVGAAIVVVMRHRAVTIIVGGGLLIGSALHHQVADVEHLISFGTVLLLALILTQREGASRSHARVSSAETKAHSTSVG